MLAGMAFCFLSLFMYFLAFSRVSHSKNGVIMFVISLKVDLIMNSSQSKSNKDQFKSKRLIGLGKYDISPSFLIFWTQSRVSKHNPQNIKNKNVAFSSPNIEIDAPTTPIVRNMRLNSTFNLGSSFESYYPKYSSAFE